MPERLTDHVTVTIPYTALHLSGHQTHWWDQQPPEDVSFQYQTIRGEPHADDSGAYYIRWGNRGQGPEYECNTCGAHLSHLRPGPDGTWTVAASHYDHDTGTLTFTDQCPSPAGIDMVTAVPLPSGKLVVADKLAPSRPVRPPIIPPLGTAAGAAQYVQAIAELGIGHVPSGSTGMHLYRRPDGVLVIGSYDDDDNQDRDAPHGWEVLARTWGDIWCVEIMDAQGYDAAVAAGTEEPTHGLPTRVEVAPGTYRLTQHLDGIVPEDKMTGDGLLVLATLERI